ncbi:MAG: AAA family ATPase [Candidatus Njordarchaeia archaeon]
MISKLEIRNFKSLKHVEIGCGKINIFIGPPNSGKSNILEAIGLLSYIGFKGEASKFLRTRITRDLFYDKDISKELKITTDSEQIKAREEKGIIEWEIQKQAYSSTITTVNSPNDIPILNLRPIDEFRKFRFYRFFNIGYRSEPSDFLLPPDGPNLLGIIYTNGELRKTVGSFFEEFGYNLVIKPDEEKIEVLKFIDGIGISLGLNLVSETLLNMVFNYAILKSNKNSVIAMEEPGSSSFPFYIKILGESIALDKTNQFFITTHNPYLLIPLLEKAPRGKIKVFVTKYEKFETKISPVDDEKLREILDMDIDVFFNLDKLIE